MAKYIPISRLLSAILMLTLVSGSTALALPAQATAHAPAVASTEAASHQPASSNVPANAQTHLAAAQLKACQNRENAINTIMTRIDTRAKNQITLFSTIATRVESFYTKQGKTASNYTQLVAAVNAAQAQANSDFGTMKSTSTLTCTASDPKGMVTAFQSYLKQEITDLQNYRTAVKNLIVGVATAQGVTLSASSQATTGGQ